ncbi:hypothetical protein [Bacillus mycoides]|uniref:hypothetical protein n=2 Tax=Bacillus mycoides TaxID=1405 RepID=UPI003D656550
MEDWLLEISGSLLVIYFFATLSIIILTFDITQCLWTSFGTSLLSRINKRNTLFWSYSFLIACIVTFVLISIIFWALTIGYFRYNGYSETNIHPFFQLTDSSILFILIRWCINWWALYFIAILGVIGAFITKNILFSFLFSFSWSFGLLAAFKSGLFFKGLLPGEGMILTVHEFGLSPLWISIINEIAALLSLGILYLIINQTNLVVQRTNR